MYLIKQLKYLNLNEVRTFSTVLHQVKDLNRKGINLLYTNGCFNTKITCNSDYGMIALRSTTPNSIAIRHYYRNYEYHPSRIVRAYRITRTWLTDHFVIAEKRMENIYSFLILLTTAALFIFVGLLNLQVGGEAGGFDVNKLEQIDKNDDDKK